MSAELREFMDRRQRQILVHSFLYYQLNTNIISDHTFDAWGVELANLMKENPEVAKYTAYYKDFLGFDGSTGVFLPYANPEIQKTGYMQLDYRKKLREKGEI